MKKLVSVMMIAAMIFALAGCSKTRQVAYVLDQDGIAVKMAMEAEDDRVEKITQTTSADVSGYSEKELEKVKKDSAEIKAQFDAVEGVSYESELKDDSFVETIIIPTDEKTLKALAEKELFPLAGDGSKELSLKELEEMMEVLGWEKQ